MKVYRTKQDGGYLFLKKRMKIIFPNIVYRKFSAEGINNTNAWKIINGRIKEKRKMKINGRKNTFCISICKIKKKKRRKTRWYNIYSFPKLFLYIHVLCGKLKMNYLMVDA